MLALANRSRPSISLVRVRDDRTAIAVERWGGETRVDNGPFIARFTPDGRHLLVNVTYSDPDVLDGGWGAPRGAIMSVRLNAARAADGSPLHQIVSNAGTGVTPEGFAVSPDGRWVVTTNLEGIAELPNAPRQERFASLTLIRLDQASGGLERVGDFPFEGMLPEMAIFDNASAQVAVTTFAHFDERSGGSIDFWRLAFDPWSRGASSWSRRAGRCR